MKLYSIKHKSGFTLLFASLIVSLLLAVGLAILNITLQQLLLSSAAKESQFAFYNADTGVECALYSDKAGKGFATTTPTTSAINNPNDILCAITNPVATVKNFQSPYQNGNAVETDFDLIWSTASPGQCPQTSGPTIQQLIHVEVKKSVDGVGNVDTVIRSRGYNDCNGANIRRVERGFQTTY